MIAYGEVRRFHYESELIYETDEQPPSDEVESQTQEEKRLARNKKRRKETKDANDKA